MVEDEPATHANASSSPQKPKPRHKRYRRYIVQSRQEISACLKYLLFIANFIFWICGLACTILGIYLYAKDYRAIFEAIDFFLNPSVLLIVCGCIVFVLSFLGCTGALRENACMLKMFSLCLFFSYICLVILAFVVFMLFYSDTKTGLSIHSLLQSGVRKYHDNENMRELMDYLQSNLACCGATSQGYKDWNTNPLYNCSPSNPTPEQCGVPPSCCKTGANGPKGDPARLQHTQLVEKAAEIVMPSENVSPSLPTPNIVKNPRCGFHAQDKSITDLQDIVYTDGCMQPLQRLFENHAVIIGAVIGAIIIPVCLSVTFSNVLAKQIERQRRLLEKEARREDRRRRRNRTKFRDPFAGMIPVASRNARARYERRANSLDTGLDEPARSSAAQIDKETCTKLISAENQRNQPGRSTAPEDTGKTRTRSKSEDKQQSLMPRKRSGNPELPPIPAEKMQAEAEKAQQAGKKKGAVKAPDTGAAAKKKVDVIPKRGMDAIPKRIPPPVNEEQKTRQKKVNENGRRRSRSRGNQKAAYTGPVIVEIESVTNDTPQPAPVKLSELLIVDETDKKEERNETGDVNGTGEKLQNDGPVEKNESGDRVDKKDE